MTKVIAASIAEADALAAGGAKIFLTKRTVAFISEPASLPHKAARNPPD